MISKKKALTIAESQKDNIEFNLREYKNLNELYSKKDQFYSAKWELEGSIGSLQKEIEELRMGENVLDGDSPDIESMIEDFRARKQQTDQAVNKLEADIDELKIRINFIDTQFHKLQREIAGLEKEARAFYYKLGREQMLARCEKIKSLYDDLLAENEMTFQIIKNLGSVGVSLQGKYLFKPKDFRMRKLAGQQFLEDCKKIYSPEHIQRDQETKKYAESAKRDKQVFWAGQSITDIPQPEPKGIPWIGNVEKYHRVTQEQLNRWGGARGSNV